MEVQQVLQFLHKNGFLEAEFALKQDISDKGACDFEKFLFPMNLPLPPVRVPASAGRRGDGSACGPGLGRGSGSDSSGDEEFKSLGSSTTGTGVCSSEFTNPYGRRSTSQAGSDSSSERLSQFGTAREYQDFDMQTDLWYDDKDDGHYMTPSFLALDPFGCPSEDKFITTTDTWNQPRNQGFQSEENEKQTGSSFQLIKTSIDDSDVAQVKDYYDFDRKINPDVGIKWDLVSLTDGSNGSESDLKVTKDKITNSGRAKDASRSFGGRDASIKDFKTPKTTEENFLHDNGDGFRVGEDDLELLKGSQELIGDADEHESATPEDVSYWETNENEYEVFELRIIHRKNRTGFEENKDLPIVLNTIIAGRYYITEYLGSAAFSKVVQAHDIQTGVDVCLKIIKNDKDFFDQSLDEIKLLKYVNKHDPSDKHHILRLYDYFYHQEHLFIVCELLRANLYEFQKYNLESGGEPYFTMSRMQAIARQSLEALEFLHGLGIIHCDLKPENILIKSYSRCQIKVIDLGSSCFQTDNLSLYVQSRSYRAPEVILGLPYDPKIDVWSLGCILAELCSGEVLFPNEAVAMLLARMIGLLGPIDLEMLLRGEDTHKYFTKEYDLYRINEENNEMEYVIPEESSLEEEMPVLDSGFINFLKYLLQINPRRRPTAKEALQHPWLSMPY